MKKRFFASMGLAVALALGITAPAFGMNVTSAEQFEDAIKKDGVITLANDVEGDLVVPAGKTVTLDLNGHTLTNVSSHTIENHGTLTIKGKGTIKNISGGKGALYNAPDGVATIDGGLLTGSKWYVVKNLGKLTFNSGGLQQDDAGSSAIDNGYYDDLGNDCGVAYPSNATVTLTINGGSFSGGMNTVKNDDYGVLVINNGAFKNTDGPTVLNWCETTINGGTFDVNENASGVIAIGHFNDDAGRGKLTINGGTFTAANDGAKNLFSYGKNSSDGGSFEIKGGEFYGDATLVEAAPCDPAVSAGTFSDVSAVKYVVGDNAALSKDGTFTVMTKAEAEEAGVSFAEPKKDGALVYFASKADADKFLEDNKNVTVAPVKIYTVTFEYGKPVSVDKGDVVAKPADDPVRDGYKFGGWYSDKACTTEFDFTQPIVADITDITVYAKWTAIHEVTFNDGFDNKKTVEVVDGDIVAKPADPTHDGYAFEGWYTTEAFAEGSEFDFATEITTDLTLWAKWKKVEVEKPATEPEKKPESKPGSALPQTGDASMLGVLAAAGAGVVLTGAGFVATRKKK